MKNAKYHDMLKDNIWEFMSMSNCKKLEGMIDLAGEQEIDMETMWKRKSFHAYVLEGSIKKPKFFDLHSRDQ